MSAANNPLQTPQLEIRRAGADVLVHDAAHEKVHVLNETAAYVLARCNGSRSAQHIADALSTATGADPVVVLRDVEVILQEFERLQLVSSQDETSGR